jgi:hypothetical protein
MVQDAWITDEREDGAARWRRRRGCLEEACAGGGAEVALIKP